MNEEDLFSPEMMKLRERWRNRNSGAIPLTDSEKKRLKLAELKAAGMQTSEIAGGVGDGIMAVGLSGDPDLELSATGGALSGLGKGLASGDIAAGILSGGMGLFTGLISAAQKKTALETQKYNREMQNIENSRVAPFMGYAKEGGAPVDLEGFELIPIQAETGEMIIFPDGSMIAVLADEEHEEQDKNEPTDLVPAGSFILSDTDKMKIKKKKIDEELDMLGFTPVFYDETGRPVEFDEVEFSELFGEDDEELSPAELGRRLKRKFRLSDQPGDIFTDVTNADNKESRLPYLQRLIVLATAKKGDVEIPVMRYGGFVEKMERGGKPKSKEDRKFTRKLRKNNRLSKRFGFDIYDGKRPGTPSQYGQEVYNDAKKEGVSDREARLRGRHAELTMRKERVDSKLEQSKREDELAASGGKSEGFFTADGSLRTVRLTRRASRLSRRLSEASKEYLDFQDGNNDAKKKANDSKTAPTAKDKKQERADSPAQKTAPTAPTQPTPVPAVPAPKEDAPATVNPPASANPNLPFDSTTPAPEVPPSLRVNPISGVSGNEGIVNNPVIADPELGSSSNLSKANSDISSFVNDYLDQLNKFDEEAKLRYESNVARYGDLFKKLQARNAMAAGVGSLFSAAKDPIVNPALETGRFLDASFEAPSYAMLESIRRGMEAQQRPVINSLVASGMTPAQIGNYLSQTKSNISDAYGKAAMSFYENVLQQRRGLAAAKKGVLDKNAVALTTAENATRENINNKLGEFSDLSSNYFTQASAIDASKVAANQANEKSYYDMLMSNAKNRLAAKMLQGQYGLANERLKTERARLAQGFGGLASQLRPEGASTNIQSTASSLQSYSPSQNYSVPPDPLDPFYDPAANGWLSPLDPNRKPVN